MSFNFPGEDPQSVIPSFLDASGVTPQAPMGNGGTPGTLDISTYPSRAKWRWGFPGSSLPDEDNYFLGSAGNEDFDAPPETGYEFAGPDNEFQTSLALTSKQRRAQRAARKATKNNERVIRGLGGWEDYQREIRADEEGGLLSGVFEALNAIPRSQTGFVSEMLRTGSPWEGFKQAVAEYADLLPNIISRPVVEATGKDPRMQGKGWGNLLQETGVLPPGLANFTAGLVLDIMLDPTSWVIGAGSKVGAIANLAKIGKAVEIVTPIGIAARLGKAGLNTGPGKALLDSAASQSVQRVYKKDFDLSRSELGKQYVNLRQQAENLTDKRVRLMDQVFSGFMQKADPLQQKVVGLYFDHPDGMVMLEGEIERLAALGTIPQNRVQYLKDAARDLRGHFDAMGQAEKELGILDQAQFIPRYEPHYAPTTDASATENLAFMQEAGIKVTPDSPGGQAFGTPGSNRVADFAKERSYDSTYQRVTNGVPTELNASQILAKRGYAHVRAVGSRDLLDAMKRTVDEGGIGAREVDLTALPEGMSLAHYENRLKQNGEALVNLYSGNKANQALVVPIEIANDLNKGKMFFSDPEVMGDFLKWFDRSQNIWKAHAVLTPGFHVRNAISNKFNMWLAGMGVSDLSHKTMDALKIASGTEQFNPVLQKAMRSMFHVTPEVEGTKILTADRLPYQAERAGQSRKGNGAAIFQQPLGAMIPPGQFKALTSLLSSRGLEPQQVGDTVDMLEMIGRHRALDQSTIGKSMSPQQFWDNIISGISEDDPYIIDGINNLMRKGSSTPTSNPLPGGSSRVTGFGDEGGTPSNWKPTRPFGEAQTPTDPSIRPPDDYEKGGASSGTYFLQKSHEILPDDWTPDLARMDEKAHAFEVSTVTPPPQKRRGVEGGWSVQGQHSFAPEAGAEDWHRWVNEYAGERWSEVTINPQITPQENTAAMIRHFADNLKWLHGQAQKHLGQDFIDKSRNWYRGANANAQALAKRYNLGLHQASAILAVLSPQKQWDDNVSQAWRLVDMIRNPTNVKFDDEMVKKVRGVKETHFDEDLGREVESIIADDKSIEFLRGKTLADVMDNSDARYQWIRAYDAVHNDPTVKTVMTSGHFMEKPLAAGEKPRKVAWQGRSAVNKVFDLVDNGDLDNISEQLGGGQKVRNFYNNILSPNSDRYVTIDTHAAAAAHLMPFGASAPEIYALFKQIPIKAGAGVDQHNLTRAIYPVYAEAYKLAAQELGLLPREMQSIVWEAVRGMYPDFLKKEQTLARLGVTPEEFKMFRESQALAIGRTASGKLRGNLDPGASIAIKKIWSKISHLPIGQHGEESNAIREELRTFTDQYFSTGKESLRGIGGFQPPAWLATNPGEYATSWLPTHNQGLRGVELGAGDDAGRSVGGNVGGRSRSVPRGRRGVETLAQEGEGPAIFSRAVGHFGTTEDIAEAGYILPDGQMLDFSGRGKAKNVRGPNSFGSLKRVLEHDEISQLYDNVSPVAAQDDFLGSGAVRIDGQTGTIQAKGPLTAAQEQRVRDVFHNSRNFTQGSGMNVELDRATENGRDFFKIYDKNATDNDIIKDIRAHFAGSQGGVRDFRQQGEGKNAAVRFLEDGRARIQLTQNANPSSLIHEMAHVLRRQLSDMEQETLAKVYGTEHSNWSVDAEEKFARNFERYLFNGGQGFQGKPGELFERMKKTMGRVYQDVDKSPIADQVSPEARDTFGKIFGEGYRSADNLLLDGKDLHTLVTWKEGWKKYGIPVPADRVGKPLTVAEARDLAQRMGVTGHGMTDMEIAKKTERDAWDKLGMTEKEYRKGMKGKVEAAVEANAKMEGGGKLDGHTVGLLKAETAGEAATNWDKTKSLSSKALALAGDNPLLRLNRTVGKTVEDLDHMALFLHALDENGKGHNPLEAAGVVKRYLFDYGNLTDVEKQVFKRLIPFYSWMRFNIPLQLHSLVNDPGRYAMMPKVINEIQAQSPDWQDLPTPDYFDEINAVRLPFMRNGKPLYLNTGLPYLDLNKVPMLGRGEEAARDFMSAVGPAAKLGYGLVANKDPYFNRPIENYPGEESPEFPISKQNDWMLGVASPLYQRAKGNISAVERGEGVPNLLGQLGIKVIPSDIQRVIRGQTYSGLAIAKAMRDKVESQERKRKRSEEE